MISSSRQMTNLLLLKLNTPTDGRTVLSGTNKEAPLRSVASYLTHRIGPKRFNLQLIDYIYLLFLHFLQTVVFIHFGFDKSLIGIMFRRFFQKASTGRRFASSSSARSFLAMSAASSNRMTVVFMSSSVALLAFSLMQMPAHNAPVDYARVKADILAAIAHDDEKRGDGTSIGPTLIRLAWHAAGTYSIFDKTGGSNGAGMRFHPENNWGANAGLKIARDFLEPIKRKYPGVSYGDLWTLAGVAAVEGMGGPVIPWKSGRKDITDERAGKPLPDGRLPNANMGCAHATNSHVRDIFGRMGFNDREIVALLGAHAVGRCHINASGYWGPWTNAETTFSNEYYRLLLEEKWTEKKTHEGKKWTGPLQFETQNGTLMMLPADLWLTEDPEFKKYVQLYAKDEEVFFRDFAAAFGKLLELGVKF